MSFLCIGGLWGQHGEEHTCATVNLRVTCHNDAYLTRLEKILPLLFSFLLVAFPSVVCIKSRQSCITLICVV